MPKAKRTKPKLKPAPKSDPETDRSGATPKKSKATDDDNNTNTPNTPTRRSQRLQFQSDKNSGSAITESTTANISGNIYLKIRKNQQISK
jgi:hypothetical protein